MEVNITLPASSSFQQLNSNFIICVCVCCCVLWSHVSNIFEKGRFITRTYGPVTTPLDVFHMTPGPRTPGNPDDSQKTSQFSVRKRQNRKRHRDDFYDIRTETYVCMYGHIRACTIFLFQKSSNNSNPIDRLSELISSEVAQFSIAVCMILVHLIESWTDNRECAEWTADQF